jgi:nitrogen fixation NifU-like protein
VKPVTIQYNENVLEHFKNPRNVGRIDDADGIGELTSDICGDHVRIYIAVADNRIVNIKFLSLGCAASIASCSVLTEMAKGKTLEEAIGINKGDVVYALGGLPEQKIHCSVLATDALHQAICEYHAKLFQPS